MPDSTNPQTPLRPSRSVRRTWFRLNNKKFTKGRDPQKSATLVFNSSNK